MRPVSPERSTNVSGAHDSLRGSSQNVKKLVNFDGANAGKGHNGGAS